MKRYEMDATMEVSETGPWVIYRDVAELRERAEVDQYVAWRWWKQARQNNRAAWELTRVLVSKGDECRRYAERAEKAEAALDDIVTAWELPGAHCELIDAMEAARKLLPEAKR